MVQHGTNRSILRQADTLQRYTARSQHHHPSWTQDIIGRCSNVEERTVHECADERVGNNTSSRKSWTALQTHFIAKWQEQLSYNNMSASQTAFKEAALLAKEEEAAEQQVLLFSLQQESHNNEMQTMKDAMEQMMTTMKSLAAQVKNSNNNNKENKNPNIVAKDGKKKKKPMTLGGKPANLKDEKSKCAHCKRWCLHLDKDCLELEENAANRSASWKTNKKPEE